MNATRCPACDFLNDREATASDLQDGPIYCNACGRTYYAGTVADPVRLLESSRIVWRRDWDAVAVGFACGVMSEVVGSWLTGWLW